MNEKSGRVTSFVPFLEGVRKRSAYVGLFKKAPSPEEFEDESLHDVRPRQEMVKPSAIRVVRVLKEGPRPVTELASEAGLSTPDFMGALQRLLEHDAVRLKGAPGREDAELTDIGRKLAEDGGA